MLSLQLVALLALDAVAVSQRTLLPERAGIPSSYVSTYEIVHVLPAAMITECPYAGTDVHQCGVVEALTTSPDGNMLASIEYYDGTGQPVADGAWLRLLDVNDGSVLRNGTSKHTRLDLASDIGAAHYEAGKAMVMGAAVLGNRVVQSTNNNSVLFEYRWPSLELMRVVPVSLPGYAYGLGSDGNSKLYASDGSNQLHCASKSLNRGCLKTRAPCERYPSLGWLWQCLTLTPMRSYLVFSSSITSLANPSTRLTTSRWWVANYGPQVRASCHSSLSYRHSRAPSRPG